MSPAATDLQELAVAFVDAGKVVPGITIDGDGRARSWWWPLPAAGDRAALRNLVGDGSPDAHRSAAQALAERVDTEVRTRLTTQRCELLDRRPGRRSLGEAWLRALVSDEPHLQGNLNPERLRAFEANVHDWVRSGRPVAGRGRLCLRVREPAPEAPADELWRIELLVQDADEPTLIVPAAQVWAGDAPLGPRAVEELLTALGQLARLAPELDGLLRQADPTGLDLSASEVVTFVRDRHAALTDAGIVVLLPSWWTRRKGLGLRVKAASSDNAATAGVTPGGMGMQAVVQFSWEASLGDEVLSAEDLEQLEKAAAAKQSLVRFRGTWVEVGADELEAVMARAGTTSEASVADVLRTSLGLEGVDGLAPSTELGGLEISGIDASGWLGELLDNAVHASVAPVATPSDFVGQLRPYQERGVGWLGFLGRLGLGACLADDMGLGKTAQVIADLLADPTDAPTLVVCPVSVLGNWQRELARFGPSLRVMAHHGSRRFRDHTDTFAERVAAHDVVLTTYSLVYRDLEELNARTWGRLVLDEAQQVKNPATKQTRAVQRLRADRRIALTGTPVENRLSELWSIMHVLNPGLLGSARSFRERFAFPIEVERDEEVTELLRRVTGPFVLRRLKSDRSIISDLPDKIEVTDRCLLTREQATLYQAVVDDLLARSEQADGIGRRGLVLAGLMRLKQVCNHPAHFASDGSPLHGRSGKLARTEELLDELLDAGDKALCFTQFTEWGDRLQPYLSQRFDREVLWLHGGVPRTKRDAMVERFQSDDGPPIFLVSLKAGGTGLNLTAASHVIHLDRWWNPAVEDQATDRAYRIGQQRSVVVHKLVSAGTVEERIDEMITAKRALADRVVGAGEDWVTSLTTDELRDVISLRRDEIADDAEVDD